MLPVTAGTFGDPDTPLPERIVDLLGRLTLAEKVALLHGRQAAVPRLGVAEFHTGTEALHGVAWLGPATVFPQALGLASMWDPELVRTIGAAVGDEARAFHRKDPQRAGLNVWSPVVNLLRDPRWGRNEEGYAEDPLLTGIIATAYATGLRGDHPRYLRTAPTLKHFLGYNNETDRSTTSSNLPPRVLHEYEMPAFRAAIAAGAAFAVMPSYNLVNGRPAHVNPMINDVVRRWTGDDLLVVSDAQAPSHLVELQGYFSDQAAGHAAALRAGLDSFTENFGDPAPTIGYLTEALERGLLTESDVDAAVRHILAIRFRLGEFDPPEGNPYAAITDDVINCPAHQALARTAARRSIVLLSNPGRMLPLAAERTRRVAVLGPLADVVHTDWYSGTLPYSVTARTGVAERLGDAAVVEYREGVDRVALRCVATGRYLVASDRPGGAPVRGETSDRGTGFDVFDWGNNVVTLRAAANGRYLTVDEDELLVNDQPGPNGWVVRETFQLVDSGVDDVLVRHVATGGFLVVDPDGAVRASASTPKTATAFAVELISNGVDEAAAVARDADLAIVVVGNHPMVNGRETEDRPDIDLPGAQDALIRAVYAANPRTVLVLSSSYPYAIGWAAEHLPAVLWSTHGGQEYGHALAEALFGDAEPGGRLTQTWYRSTAELPDLLDYDIIDTDSTYLYARDEPLFPFGHGHSYTDFEYVNLRLSDSEVDADGEVEVSVEVRNVGTRAGDEVLQLYSRQRRSRVKQPLRQLRGFRRIHLQPGEQATVTLPLRAADLGFWDVTRDRYVVETARHTLLAGRSCRDIRLTATLSVRGESIPPRDPARLRAISYDTAASVSLLDEEPAAGDAVGAAELDAWIAFADVDFGGGTGGSGGGTGGSGGIDGVELKVARSEPGGGTIELRLDDSIAGPLLAKVAVPATADRYRWTWADAPIAGQVAGRHDLYVVFDTPGTVLAELRFTATARALSR